MQKLLLPALLLLLCACSNSQNAPSIAGKKHFSFLERLKPGTEYAWGGRTAYGSLTISAVCDSGFRFSLTAGSGGASDGLDGFAHAANDSTAVFKNSTDDFSFGMYPDSIVVNGAGHDGFMGISFPGSYIKDYQFPEQDTADINFLPEAINARLKSAAGAHYQDLADFLARYDEEEAKDGAITWKIYSGGLEGLFTLSEAIVLTRGDSFFYAALVNTDSVFYYTNDPLFQGDKSKQPQPVKEWIQRVDHNPDDPKKITYTY